jgi:hypothetical protein
MKDQLIKYRWAKLMKNGQTTGVNIEDIGRALASIGDEVSGPDPMKQYALAHVGEVAVVADKLAGAEIASLVPSQPRNDVARNLFPLLGWYGRPGLR